MKDFAKSYLDFLRKELRGLNLTRILDPQEFYNKQIYDSFLPLEKSSIFCSKIEETGLLVDVGFGGGFPLLPIAKKMPAIKCIGVEARMKKVEAVRLLAKHLDLKNVELIHQRIENINLDRPSVITIKAVGKIETFLNSLHCHNQTFCFFYKGPRVEQLEPIKAPRGWQLIEDISFAVVGTEGRRFLGYKSIVPRGTIASKNNPKNSSLARLSGIL